MVTTNMIQVNILDMDMTFCFVFFVLCSTGLGLSGVLRRLMNRLLSNETYTYIMDLYQPL